MGSLEDLESECRITLGNEFVVGRARSCALVLDDRSVSAQHALLRWRRDRWSIRDLGSKNGTTVNEAELGAGQTREVSSGAILKFGSSRQRWRLIDDGPPSIAAQHVFTGDIIRVADGCLGIPDQEHPKITVYRDERNCWTLERGDEVRGAHDQQEVTLGDHRWQLWIPQHGDTLESTELLTTAPRVLRLLTVCFRVSRDQEYVELSIDDGTETTALGARSHHHMLLTLARAREQDHHDARIGHAEEGWLYTDELCKMLGNDCDTLNIHVFRARKQLTSAGIDNGGEIVQRRNSTRQLRLGTNRVAFEMM